MINADPQELSKFGDLAHRWWDPEGEFKPLHQINPLRLDWIAQYVPMPGAKVVDVGCGGGILAAVDRALPIAQAPFGQALEGGPLACLGVWRDGA